MTEVDKETGEGFDPSLRRRATIAATSSTRCLWPDRSTAVWRKASASPLYEHAIYDEGGQLLTGELMDYAIPRARMIPWIETSHTDYTVPRESAGSEGRRRSWHDWLFPCDWSIR